MDGTNHSRHRECEPVLHRQLLVEAELIPALEVVGADDIRSPNSQVKVVADSHIPPLKDCRRSNSIRILPHSSSSKGTFYHIVRRMVPVEVVEAIRTRSNQAAITLQ